MWAVHGVEILFYVEASVWEVSVIASIKTVAEFLIW